MMGGLRLISSESKQETCVQTLLVFPSIIPDMREPLTVKPQETGSIRNGESKETRSIRNGERKETRRWALRWLK